MTLTRKKPIRLNGMSKCNLALLHYYCKKTYQFTTPFKHDIRQLADLKQQISQKDDITLQHIAKMSLCCEVISSFVIFAVLDLRVGRCCP